jgi:hypothetical protein
MIGPNNLGAGEKIAGNLLRTIFSCTVPTNRPQVAKKKLVRRGGEDFFRESVPPFVILV